MEPKVGVAAFIFDDEGQIIMGERLGSHGAGTWALPGGHLEFGETFEECAAREVLEETGLEVTEVKFLTATNNVWLKEGKHYCTVFMGCRINGQRKNPEKIMEPEKCGTWEWIGWDELKAWAQRQADGENVKGGGLRGELFLPMVDLFTQRPDLNPI